MPQLTAASDLSGHGHSKGQEWYDLPKQLRELCEAADLARSAWAYLDDFQTATRRDFPADYHDAKVAEIHTYNAWQSIESAFAVIYARWRAEHPSPDDEADRVEDLDGEADQEH